MAATQLTDLIVPSIFTPYALAKTEEKTRIIQSGAMQVNSELNSLLSGGGITFNQPFFKDLANSTENITTDNPATLSTPNNITTGTEIQVRLSRNNSWSSMDLNSALTNEDPMGAIADRVSDYWARRLQAAVIATMKGVFADNDAAPTGSEHVAGDLTKDIKGAGFTDGTTNLSENAVIDAFILAGDSFDRFKMMMVHSVVFARMAKRKLVTSDFRELADGKVIEIFRFLGREVIIDDSMPSPATGVYETWIFGEGALQHGNTAPVNATETDRIPNAGNGGGQDVLHNRVQWIIHPVGHKYAGTPANGGPDNTATANNLANASSWQRVFPERKQIGIARLITREF